MEDDFQWKTTFGGRWPLVEDNLWWKTTFSGRQPSVEDNHGWKMIFGGRWSLVEDDLWWKTTLGGSDLCWKTTFSGRLPAVEDNLLWKTIFVGSLHAAYFALHHFSYHIWLAQGLFKMHQSSLGLYFTNQQPAKANKPNWTFQANLSNQTYLSTMSLSWTLVLT